jgi:hypothetical protein
MRRKDKCRDNAVSESFFHMLKTEPVRRQRYQTGAEAKDLVSHDFPKPELVVPTLRARRYTQICSRPSFGHGR